MYVHMQNDRVKPDPYTFVSLFKACGNINDLEVGRLLHATVRSKGFGADAHTVTTMVSMYGKCGAIKEAENVFVGATHTDVILWNSLLSAYVEVGQAEKALQLYTQMQVEGLSPDKQTLVIALQACGSLALNGQLTKVVLLEIGQALHADARLKGFLSDISVSTTLVSMYGKCGASHKAENVFQELCSLDIVPCTAMISAYVDGNEKEKALKLYRQMEMEGTTPTQQTLVCALQACAIFENLDGITCLKEYSMKEVSLEFVKAIHCDALRRDQASDLFVSNALISMYGKCGGIREAEDVFARLLHPDVVSWTALLSNFVDLGYAQKALQLYREMHAKGVSPNRHTFVIALQACVILFEEGFTNNLKDEQSAKLIPPGIVRALHVDVERQGLASEVLIATTLVTVYGKCGSVVEAEDVFRNWQGCCTVLRNAMLSVFVNHGQGCKALEMYEQTRNQKPGPDVCTVICMLQACSDIGTMDTARELHFDIISASLELHTFLASALIHAYGRNASMVDAEAIAYELPQPDIVSWNACISGYAGEGKCILGLQMFEEIRQAGFAPNEVSFTSLFSACSHAGLIEEGIHYFDFMERHCSFSPELKHYVNIVDSLGRAGDFQKVRNLLQKPALQADADIWSCLLGACCTHGNIQLGRLAFLNVVNLHPQPDAAYVLMSNIHAEWQAANAKTFNLGAT